MSERREQITHEREKRVVLEYTMPVYVEVDEASGDIHRVTSGYEDMEAVTLWNGSGTEHIQDKDRFTRVLDACMDQCWPSWD